MVPLAFGLVIGAGIEHQARGARWAPPAWSPPACWARRTLADDPRLDARHAVLAARAVVLRTRAVDRLDHGPATDSVMGAVPEEKAGVASAMNDVTRQVAGALGVAVIGSLVTSLYSTADRRRHRRAARGSRATAAADSVGAAVAVADGLPASAGTALEHAAANAYTDALGLGLLAAAAVALVGAAFVARLLPPHHRPAEPVRKAALAAVAEGTAIPSV